MGEAVGRGRDVRRAAGEGTVAHVLVAMGLTNVGCADFVMEIVFKKPA